MTTDEMLDSAASYAKVVLVGNKGAALMPTWLVQEKNKTTIVGTPWGDDKEKSAMIYAMRQVIKNPSVVSYSFISEAWQAREDPDHPIGLLPRDREDRLEVVIITACDRQGGKMRTYEMKRGPDATVTELVKQGEVCDHLAGRLHNLFTTDD